MSESPALSRVLDQAAAAAAEAGTPSTALVPQYQPSTALATRPSLDSMVDSAGITVDQFLTLKYEGFRLGDNKALFDRFVASLDMSQVVPILQVRGNKDGQTTFIKSYDGVMTPQGQNFQQATENLRSRSDKLDGPYQTSEIPLTVLEDFKVGTETVKAGTVIGTTPPITGVKFFASFIKELRAQGLQDSKVKVNVIHLPQSNVKKNEWGVVTFELIGEIE